MPVQKKPLTNIQIQMSNYYLNSPKLTCTIGNSLMFSSSRTHFSSAYSSYDVIFRLSLAYPSGTVMTNSFNGILSSPTAAFTSSNTNNPNGHNLLSLVRTS